MSVNELRFTSDDLRLAATKYEATADRYAAARNENARAAQDTESWGPLAYESRRAAIDAINARERTLTAEEDKNRAMARQLRMTADQFDAMTEHNAANLTINRD
ncbi:Protein of uncharacterised function (DUF2580) [Mycobacteroides abscessus subsp. massiliense]|uniref:type VII secretion target n=1 Tax=Mycobacteroides abscessus TaxID=36809 RepID=UPI0009A6FB3D|nr:type VII secretion target [Mycobacteroides abscessus]SKK91767.1 Protein of uncharacterised function (DUF2580) [Mycobacteroides abscessus subsp. massiliense]